jgi:hypothetical protein
MPRYSIDISIPPLLDRVFAAPMLLWRRIWHGFSFRKIKLSNSKYYAHVDHADFHELSKYNWFVDENGRYKRAIRIDKQKGPKAVVHMHRQIMKNELNAKRSTLNTDLLVDHIDNNALNNTRHNLRLVTPQQNQMNRKPQRNKQYKGITKHKRSKPWKAKIFYNNRHIHIGYYKTQIEAAKAYDQAAKKYFGEFAYLNFPENKQKGLKGLLLRHFCHSRKGGTYDGAA